MDSIAFRGSPQSHRLDLRAHLSILMEPCFGPVGDSSEEIFIREMEKWSSFDVIL